MEELISHRLPHANFNQPCSLTFIRSQTPTSLHANAEMMHRSVRLAIPDPVDFVKLDSRVDRIFDQ